MGYTDVHYAVKDAYSFTGVLITIAFFTFVAILFVPVTIIVLLVWLTVRLFQRHKARRLETAATAVPTGTEPHAAHAVTDAVPYRIRGADRGPGRVDLYCYDCTCGDIVVGTTPGQARTELREHLHEGIDWANVD
mgnify:CR=1 FL=1